MIARLLGQPDLGEISKKMKRSRNYNHNIENFIINSFGNVEEALLKGLKPKNMLYPLGAATSIGIDMKVSKPKHTIEISNVLTKCFAELVRLNRKFAEEMDEEGIEEEDRIKVYYQIFGGEVADFEFVKDDDFNLKEYIKPIEKTIKQLYEGIDEK